MKYFILVPLSVCFLFSAFSQQQESITITTYYPSPSGIFDELLVSQRMAVGDVNGDNQVDVNDLAADAAGSALPNSLAVVNSLNTRMSVGDVNGDGIINGGDLNPTVDANGDLIRGTLNVATSLGIGTTTPLAALHVQGAIFSEGADGDLNGDGSLTNADATAVLNYLNGTGTLTQLEYAQADFNGDGSVTMADYLGMMDVIDNGAALATAKSNAKAYQDRAIHVDRNRNVGIGTTTPQQFLGGGLDVNPEINIGAATTAYPFNPFVRLDVHGAIRITPDSRGTNAPCGASGLGDDGTLIFDDTTKSLLYCDGTYWKPLLPVVTSYTGNGVAAGQFIDLNFFPRAVMVASNTTGRSAFKTSNMGGRGAYFHRKGIVDGTPHGSSINNLITVGNESPSAAQDGFTVYGAMNDNNETYFYIAWP